MSEYSEKYRPRKAGHLIGSNQKTIAENLIKLTKSGECPKKILFCGKTGVGKTTIARMVARYILNHNKKAYKHCIQEVDCENDNSKDSVKTQNGFLRQRNIFNLPSILILDEFQGYKIDARKAWLKVLEPNNPLPKDTYIFATTTNFEELNNPSNKKAEETNKALLGRFNNIYHLSTPSFSQMCKFLNHIKEEKISEKDIKDIVTKCSGNMRKAVLMLESYTNGTYDNSGFIENINDKHYISDLLFKDKSISEIINFFKKLKPDEKKPQIDAMCNYALNKTDTLTGRLILKHFGKDCPHPDVQFAYKLIVLSEEKDVISNSNKKPNS